MARVEDAIHSGYLPVRTHCGILLVVVSVSELVSAEVLGNGRAAGRQ